MVAATSALAEMTSERDTYRDQVDKVRQETADRLEELTTRVHDLGEEVAARTFERDQALGSPEFRIGRLFLDKLKLRLPLRMAEKAWMRGGHGLTRARLKAAGAGLPFGRRGEYKALATACWNFPIYSQTFVYQELVQLMNAGFDLRFIYSKLDPRSYLHDQFARLWGVKRKLVLHRDLNRADMLRYEARMPEQVKELRRILCDASGMSDEDLRNHDSFHQAFTFTRLVEDYGPDYLHSYFFYDRSLMTLVAANLLGLPRGVSCYADHLMDDYELKVVPLHMKLCDIVIATSARIKRELIAPCYRTWTRTRSWSSPTPSTPRSFRSSNASGPRTRPQPYRFVCREPHRAQEGFDLSGGGDPIASPARSERRVPPRAGRRTWGIQSSQDYRQQLLELRSSPLDLWGTVHLEGSPERAGGSQVPRNLAISSWHPSWRPPPGTRTEFPTALLEAMATGIAVVATDAGSIEEVIDDRREKASSWTAVRSGGSGRRHSVPARGSAPCASRHELRKAACESAQEIRREGVCEKQFPRTARSGSWKNAGES